MAGFFNRFLVGALALLLSAAAVPAETVQSLRYGVTLFHLYQGDYFNSLTELMVGQQQAELGPHTENAELLRGGIALSYGMDREAEQVFTALLSEPRPGVDRGRAWFYLAKLAWQRGELGRVEAALDQAGEISNERLAEEAVYLRAAVAIRRGALDRARTLAAAIPEESDWRFYYHYNMGAALAVQGAWDDASVHFRQLQEASSDAELKSLRDRAYTASGYAQMGAGNFSQAREDFVRVRLESPLSDRALLGYGWAAMEGDNYMAALSPWQALSEQPPVNQSVRESLLAIPYAYEQLGRDGLALAHYREASNVLQTELDNVRRAIALFRGEALPELLQLQVDVSDEWLFGDDILPVSEEAPYLRHLIASHAFQGAMKELRDLQRIQSHLSRSQKKLAVLTQADLEQQANWEMVIDGGGRERMHARYAALQQQLEALRTRLAAAAQANDGRALADADRRAQWQRVERATANARALGAAEAQQNLLRLYRGLLVWDDSEQFTDRMWRARRELATLEQALAESTERMSSLDTAISNRRQSNFSPRIVQLSDRVAEQQVTVAGALLQSESGLRRVAIAELEQQAIALSRSLGQSRLAVARLYDRSSAGVSP